MIKKTAAIFFTFLILLCHSLPLASQGTEADNPYEPFSIKVPDGWQANFSPGAAGLVGSKLKLAAPDGLAIYIVQLESLSLGQWDKMINDMSFKPAPDHGLPNHQGDDIFVVTFNDKATGMTGRKIYQRVTPALYVLETAYGSNPDLPPLINSVEIMLPADN